MKQITILDIAKVIEWKDIKRSIKHYYPTDKNDYSELFEDLKKYRKRKHTDKDEFITVFVSGFVDRVEEGDGNNYGIATNKYSMSFRSWKTLANIPIHKNTLKHYLYKDILAHFIWEITFYGNEKDAKKIAMDVNASSKQIRKKFDEEKKQQFEKTKRK